MNKNKTTLEELDVKDERFDYLAFRLAKIFADALHTSKDITLLSVLKEMFALCENDNEKILAHQITESLLKKINGKEEKEKPVEATNIYPPADTTLEVKKISDSDDIREELLMSGRAKELSEAVGNGYGEMKNKIDVMIAVSKLCKHPNELIMCGFFIGAFEEFKRGDKTIKI